MARLSNIVLHCSDSEFGSAAMIRKWHLLRGWSDVGYHRVIKNGWPTHGMFVQSEDGAIECGRDLDGDNYIVGSEVGAHTLGYNTTSIGICLIGKELFTVAQIASAMSLINDLRDRYGIHIRNIYGHYETEKAGGKTCPNIDMDHFRYMLELTDIRQPV